MVWSVGLAPACGWLDGQDGQLPVDHAMFSRPCAQRLDDVGDVVSAGVRLPVSLPAAGDIQLNLEARHVQALGICVACPRRRPVVRRCHAPPGSPGAPQSAGVRRTLIYGHSFLGVPGVKTALPLRAGGLSLSKVMTARYRAELRGGRRPPEAILSAPSVMRYPIGNIRLGFITSA